MYVVMYQFNITKQSTKNLAIEIKTQPLAGQ